MHEMQKTDGLALAGEPAWHGLGTVVEGAMAPREALELAGLDWELESLPVFAGRGGDQELPGYQAIRRADTRETFQVARSGYQPFTNFQLAELAQGLADAAGGRAEVETFGSIRGGRVVYCLLRTGTFEVQVGDRVVTYALLSTSHDGTRAVRVQPTSVRVVCSNTLHVADAGNGKAAWSWRHSAGLRESIEDGLRGIEAAVDAGERFASQARAMARRTMSAADRAAFFQRTYERAYGALPKPDSDAGVRAIERAEVTVRRWTAALEDPTSAGGSLWGALNAVTRHADHGMRTRASQGQGRADARRSSILDGAAAKVKGAALLEALA